MSSERKHWCPGLVYAVVVDPVDYPTLLDQLKGAASGDEALQFRKRMAWKAFQHTASYDATVAEWMWGQVGGCGALLHSSFCPPGQRLSHSIHMGPGDNQNIYAIPTPTEVGAEDQLQLLLRVSNCAQRGGLPY